MRYKKSHLQNVGHFIQASMCPGNHLHVSCFGCINCMLDYIHLSMSDQDSVQNKTKQKKKISIVEPLYNTIVFHQNTHKRHPIARP